MPARVPHLTQVRDTALGSLRWVKLYCPEQLLQAEAPLFTSVTNLSQGCPQEPHPSWGQLGLT